jgi:hypothetical protein
MVQNTGKIAGSVSNQLAVGGTTIYHIDSRTAVRPLAGCSVLLP